MSLRREFRLGQAVTFAIVTLFSLTACAPSSSATLLGIDWLTGNLSSINTATGAATLIGPTGINSPIGIAFSPGGTLYALTVSGLSLNSNLYTINPNTGAATLATVVRGLITGEGDIAFSPTGTLYEVGGMTGLLSEGLFAINTSTGLATTVGTIGFLSADLSAMAFDSSGNLWVFDQGGSQLYRVDPATAAILATVNVNIAGTGGVAGMAFNPADGTLFVGTGLGTNGLYTLNTTTGNLSPIGPSGINISGLAFTLDAPEPAPCSVILAGLVSMALWRRAAR
jgi:DNA-binding beta-propeller fold protein YncE